MTSDPRCPRCGKALPTAGAVCPDCAGAPEGETLAADARRSVLPQSIGPYRVHELLGEGGMGVVYLAEQREPVRRRVALKVIKPGMDSEAILARFETERQALAILNHPGVAKVFDAGATDDGRPYFVMEYVAGDPITTHCDTHNLGLHERLELFRQVCDAIQHAHHKGIIHRDIKPSNVLVALVDGQAQVKVIDFGVAKATDQRLTDKTLFTMHGSLLGTPEYMSPEQAGLSGFDVDTRSDVYSLGVLLYELLVGARPFDSKTLRGAAAAEMLRIIHEDEPPRPTTRLAALGAEATLIARHRRQDPRSLVRRLRGELEWITMRSLEKNPAHRYHSATELSDDIGRYLKQQPVVAGPPGAGYRLRKFTRRHRIGVGAAAVLLLGLVVGVAGFGIGLVRALEAESVARDEAARANREARTSGHVSEFLVRLFEVPDPSEARGNAVTAREILDEGAARLHDQALADEPQVQAQLQETIGRVYRNLGLYASARGLLEQSLASRRAIYGDQSEEVATSMNLLAQVREYQGEYEEAEILYRETLELRRRLHGEQHPEVANSLNNLAALQRNIGDLDAAAALYEQALAIDRSLGSTDPGGIAATMSNLALVRQDQGDLEAAEALMREALSLMRDADGNDHPNVAVATNNLAMMVYNRGDLGEAARLFEEALAMDRQILGDDHPETGNVMSNLAATRKALGQVEVAEALYRESLEIKRAALGPRHPQVAITMSQLAGLLLDREDGEAAATLFALAVDILRETVGPDHWMVAQVRSHHGTALASLDRRAEAEAELLAAYTGLDAAFGADHVRTRETAARLVALYDGWGRPAAADPYREPADD